MTVLLRKVDVAFMPRPNVYELVLDPVLPPVALVTAALGLIFDGDRLLLTRLAARGWDIPGGHVEAGETPEATVRREIYEETAVHVRDLRLFAHEKFTVNGAAPAGYQYPHPVSYQVFYLGRVASLAPFQPGDEARQRRFLTPEEAKETEWGNRGAALYEAALERMQREYGTGHSRTF